MVSLRRAALHVASAQVVQGASDAAIAFVLVRTLGSGGFGVWATAVVLVTIVQLVGSVGLPAAATYYVGGEAPDRRRAVALRSVALAAALGVGTGLLLLAALQVVDLAGELTAVAQLGVALAAMALILASVGSGALLGLQATSTYAAMTSLQAAVPAGVAVVTSLVSRDPGGVLLAWGVARALVALLTARAVAAASGAASRPSGVRAPALLSYGVRSQAANLLSYLNYRIDVLLLSGLASTVAAGQYAAIVTIGEAIWLLSTAPSMALFGRLPSLPDEESRRQATERVVRFTVMLTVPAALVLGALARLVLRIVYGEELVAATGPFRIVLVGIVALAVSRVLASHISAAGRPGLTAMGSGIAFAINVALNLLLIPAHGATGAAIATAVSYSAALGHRLLVYRSLAGGGFSLARLVPTWRDVRALATMLPRGA